VQHGGMSLGHAGREATTTPAPAATNGTGPDAAGPDAARPDAARPDAAGPDAADDAALTSGAEALAGRLLADADAGRGRRERAQGRRIARMLEDPDGLEFILALTDEVLRIRDPRRAARHLRQLVGCVRPGFLGRVDAALLTVGVAAAGLLPRVVMPLVRQRVRAELAGFVIAAEDRPLGRHIARREAQGTRLNLNVLGEAVLGEEEAGHRLDAVLALLARPDVDYVSVKVSAVSSQINVVAFDAEVERIAGRVRRLYDAAMAGGRARFVNLDMEEYRDLALTVAVFRRVLDEEPYAALDAGVVLQAYIPDSLGVLTDLAAWARDRHSRTGGRIKIRIVKGANLAMERVEAELAGWPQAPFATKAEVDANYKRMLDVALDPANAGALRVGVATHNLFEAAWALTVARHRGVEKMVEMEMLEGMAPALAAAVHHEAGGLLLYAPIARTADSESVIAYLVRRFDENTSPDNFLRNQFSLRVGSPTWAAERDRFTASVAARHHPAAATNRVQDRRRQDRQRQDHQRPGDAATAFANAANAAAPSANAANTANTAAPFANAADTDWSLAANRAWIDGHLADLDRLPIGVPGPGGLPVVPLVVAGTERTTGPTVEGIDVGRPDTAGPAYHWVRADPGVVDEAVAAARVAGQAWRARPAAERRRALLDVAEALEADRGRLIALMTRDAGKTVAEADPEVSEAVDFARYYAEGSTGIEQLVAGGAAFTPYGTVAVIPPWNFPLAIPAGGILAALAAGNAVILKPAPETVATAWALATSAWRAGIPRDLLQLVSCADDEAGHRLVTHPGVDAVILTGSWDTARLFLGWRPGLRIHAETSGKNAVVVTATADLDTAVADLVRSAFGHAGQKCSAASLGIVEASVYDDPAFRRQLADAVRSLRPGPGEDLSTTMGPLIRTPDGPLHDALHRLGAGETWLVEPHQVGDNPRLWTPGVKLGVAPGSSFHLTECFGPVLGLMRAVDLEQAVAWQNQPAYGLTAGLQSLDPAEIARWRDSVQAGNLYVNRHITGAVVRRQPFGGWKRSVVGPGHKAGGPHYVSSLGTWATPDPARLPEPEEFARRVAATVAGDLAPADPSGLASEANVLRVRPLRSVMLRAGGDVPDAEVALALAAARAVGVAVTLSSPTARPDLDGTWVSGGGVTIEDEDALVARLGRLRPDKVRLLGAGSDTFRLAAHDAGIWLDDVGLVAHPLLEALRWAREQALSETRHRHGDLTGRHAWPQDARFGRWIAPGGAER
jgi:RHH-type proline utilization regulon transcriptional repressor/proline dehydrogenase/delta 1-pyrroline-5-carboxylate dehydrogenase